MSIDEPDGRDYMLRVRLTQGEKKMLASLSKNAGLKASQTVRQLIRLAHDRQKREQGRRRLPE